jgi:hypothetical protein
MADAAIPASVKLPPNLLFVGTVNIDETVQPFSDKVKDRANTITVPIDLEAYMKMLQSAEANSAEELKAKAFTFAKTERSTRTVRILIELQSKLTPYQIGFGYRIMDEVLAYLYENASGGLLGFEVALDYQVEQKILPKVRGRGKTFGDMIACRDQTCGACLACRLSALGLSRSAKRARRMKTILADTGFTSYDAANQ